MWPFHKKKREEKKEIESKYKVGFSVSYLTNEFETIPGKICKVYLDSNGEVRYDVQVGGECPYVKRGLKEDQVKFR